MGIFIINPGFIEIIKKFKKMNFIVQYRANTDLNDNDLQLSIIQGINYNVPNPKEIDKYFRYEFPFPSLGYNYNWIKTDLKVKIKKKKNCNSLICIFSF